MTRSAFVLVAVYSIACEPSPVRVAARSDGPTEPFELRVATINVRCLIDDWDARLPLLVDELSAFDADVIGLQEACSDSEGRDNAEALTTALAARGQLYTSIRATTHIAWDAYEEGPALLLRSEPSIVHEVTLPAGMFTRKLLAARIEPHGRPLVVATTHLDYREPSVRMAQLELAIEMLDELASAGEPVVVTGDLNEPPAGPVSRALEAVGYEDAWRTNGGEGATAPAHAPTERIDYVWQRGFETREIGLLFDTPQAGVYASDHLGLGARLSYEPVEPSFRLRP